MHWGVSGPIPWRIRHRARETFDAFRDRLSAALDDVAAEAVDQRVLVITHGGAIRLLRCLVEKRSYGDMAGIDVPHASLHPLPWPARVTA